jgi:glutathione synthase/RimK-type ligase-like ATP-grasp enzyme
MDDDFRLKAAEELSKEIGKRLNQHYSANDKEAVEKFIERKREESDRESKRLETETKSEIDELKSTITRAGRNIKVEVTDSLEKLNFKNCLCCNQPTLRTEIHDICIGCHWQDDPAAWNDIDDNNNANGISLREARINYESHGNCDGL